MVYQSFPWADGDSKSYEKLQALHLPDLNNKSVLDIGCNEGFFCGWAKFAGASEVTGIDKNQRYLDFAMAFFPECKFKCQSWDDLDDKKYDVIIFLSAIHYATDQEKTIHALMQRLTPGGILVLEIGIAPGNVDDFVQIRRPAGGVYGYPTITKLCTVLSPYSFTYIGPSVNQQGDNTPRHVFHISNRKIYSEEQESKFKTYTLHLVKKLKTLNLW